METNSLTLICLAIILFFMFILTVAIEGVIKFNHKQTEKEIKKYIDANNKRT